MIELYPHQREALKLTKDKNRVAYYLDMGLGKTFIGSEKMLSLNSRMNLLICQKSKIEDWKEHFMEFYSKEFMIYDLTIGKEMVLFQEILQKETKENILVIINYELAFRRNSLLKLKGFTLMLDESSMIQNEMAKRTKFILKMDPENVILLSGTPTSGKYEKLYSQLRLLGWTITRDLYWKQYIDTEIKDIDGFKIISVKGYKNVERLKNKLSTHGAIFMKSEEVFDLPEMIEQKVKIRKSKEYSKFIKDSIITINLNGLCEFKDESDFYGEDVTPRKELVGDTTLTKMLYSRMLCGAYSKSKIDTFKDLVSSTEDRIIVFYNFNNELEIIKKVAADNQRSLSIVNGSERNLEAYENQDNSITAIQYQAGAMGLNLQKANKIIYFTLPLSSELFEQSKKRIHRIGQSKSCFYYYLIVQNSIDEKIFETLKMRKDYTDALFKKYEE